MKVNAMERYDGIEKTGITEVYLMINSGLWANEACKNDVLSRPLPELKAPEGAREIKSLDTFSEIATAMNASTLAAHYNAQMIAANWILLDGGHDGPIAWSKWTSGLNSDKYVLIFQDLAEEDHHILMVLNGLP
jgi:hypothetical protein